MSEQPNDQLIETIERALKQSETLPSYRDYVENNADRWLRALLEEKKRLETKYHVDMNNYRSQIQTWQQQHDSQIISLSEELEQVKSQLSAKDKVLEQYANRGSWTQVQHIESLKEYFVWTGEDKEPWNEARSILSKYKGEDTHERD